jgi:hypothetical protein
VKFTDPDGRADVPFSYQQRYDIVPKVQTVGSDNGVLATVGAGFAGVLNIGSTLINFVPNSLGAIGEGIQNLDDAIPDEYSFTGMGLQHDLLVLGVGELMLANEITLVTKGIQQLATTTKCRGVLNTIRATGKAPEGFKGGQVFKNKEGLLPTLDKSGKSITYREWDVNPLKKGVDRGAERIVTGSDGRVYYTTDHYKTFNLLD